ncbi:MAG: AAA family ATPase, partial [Pseudolabrys sp.]
MTEQAQTLEGLLQTQLGRVVYGLEELIHALTIALISGGHVLLEGAPGLGKTLLSKTFAQVLGGQFRRVQGTADLMPTEWTGVHVFDTRSSEFVFRPGPLFADVVLVDEINRAGPTTQ